MNADHDNSADRLAYPLLDNALDFLLSAAEHAGQNHPRSWKYAILHLIAGIELLLKARLELEHWSLLFQDVDKASKSTFKSGDFRSADFESVCKRLEMISSVPIEKKDREQLYDLRKLRHKLEHFGIDIDVPQVRSLVAKGLSLSTVFYENHLKEEIGDSEDEILGEIVIHLREFEEFVRERLEAVLPSTVSSYFLRECPRCWQDTCEIQDDNMLRCYFCGYYMDAQTLAEELTEHDVDICPECGRETLAFIIYNNEEAGWECCACGTDFDFLDRCSLCNKLHGGEGPICSDCFDHIVNKDTS